MTDQKITFKYILAVSGAVFFTWLLHEFTHWATSELLGYESMMRLNSVSPINSGELTELHKVYISASGPLMTIFQAIIVFFFLKNRGWHKLMYPLLFTPLYMRFLAGAMNFIKPNDEGRIGEFLGIGVFTISIVVVTLLIFLVHGISKKYQLNWKFNTWTTIIVMLVSSVLILSDLFLKIRVL